MDTAITAINEMLHKIQYADDTWLEHHHDWVQVAFPLFVPSPINPDAPLLTFDLVEHIQSTPSLVNQVERGMMRMAHYFRTTSHWAEPYNHNLLRITRILFNISYTLSCGRSHWFLRMILRRCEELGFTPSADTVMYWSCAANGLSYNPTDTDDFTLS